MTYIFWFSLIMLIYTYFGYPAYMFARARMAKRPVRKDLRYKPFVSVIFSSHNEEAYIENKIRNLLDSDYPEDKLEILIGSDGSDDKTNEILARVKEGRVRTFIFTERRGKVSVINDLVKEANGEILVLCDTRQTFERDAIGHLAANFKDRSVGCVSGELIFEKGDGDTAVSQGVGVYWNYEKFIRKCESAAYSMVGATGAIYAIRRELYSPPPANTILDDVYIPLSAARRGYRCIVEEKARAYDKPALTPSQEYKRKVRTLCGNHQIFAMFKDLFNPFSSVVAAPLFSHKFLRTVAPFFMIAAFVSNIFIVTGSPFYVFFMVAQGLFYVLAIFGSPVPYMFCHMNFTALVGLYRFVFGKQNIAWEK